MLGGLMRVVALWTLVCAVSLARHLPDPCTHKKITKSHPQRDLEVIKHWKPYDPVLDNDLSLSAETKARAKQYEIEEQNEKKTPHSSKTTWTKPDTKLEYPDCPCLNLLISRIEDAPEPQPEAYRDTKSDMLQERTVSYVLDTVLGSARPTYTTGTGQFADGVQSSLDELFSLLELDQRPLAVEMTILSGSDHALSWVLLAQDNAVRVFQASPSEGYGLRDWISPEEWEIKSTQPPVPTTDFEMAKFGFGGGQSLKNEILTAYKNNLLELARGLCSLHPTAKYAFAANSLWGSTQGMGHSENCNIDYAVYEFSPNACMFKARSDATEWRAAAGGQYREYGTDYTS